MSVCPAALDATVISEILEVLTALKVDREPSPRVVRCAAASASSRSAFPAAVRS